MDAVDEKELGHGFDAILDQLHCFLHCFDLPADFGAE
jgi:hypothetical protein